MQNEKKIWNSRRLFKFAWKVSEIGEVYSLISIDMLNVIIVFIGILFHLARLVHVHLLATYSHTLLGIIMTGIKWRV